MLKFAEEIILLMLDDDGKFVGVPDRLLRYGLAGGVLMDLALENRIDTDVDKLVLVDSTPLGAKSNFASWRCCSARKSPVPATS